MSWNNLMFENIDFEMKIFITVIGLLHTSKKINYINEVGANIGINLRNFQALVPAVLPAPGPPRNP